MGCLNRTYHEDLQGIFSFHKKNVFSEYLVQPNCGKRIHLWQLNKQVNINKYFMIICLMLYFSSNALLSYSQKNIDLTSYSFENGFIVEKENYKYYVDIVKIREDYSFGEKFLRIIDSIVVNDIKSISLDEFNPDSLGQQANEVLLFNLIIKYSFKSKRLKIYSVLQERYLDQIMRKKGETKKYKFFNYIDPIQDKVLFNIYRKRRIIRGLRIW